MINKHSAAIGKDLEVADNIENVAKQGKTTWRSTGTSNKMISCSFETSKF